MATQARVTLDNERTVGAISPLLFSGFAEHMGRCIYQGIYEPASPHADPAGLRTDVMAALRELNFRSIRYPGGNFVSGYNWRDGIGPQAQRPRRRDLAWQSVETNQFGTHEFMHFCQELGTEPILGLNFGTASIAAAGDYVEYCNAPVGTRYADLRAANGSPTPFGVKRWCLGNEMDGPWQIGHLDAVAYGQKALEAAKIMRWHDPSIELILCGSSSSNMPSYPEWDRLVLEQCYDAVDYLSMHYYAENNAQDSASYLASARGFEDHIDTLAATVRYVRAKQRSTRQVTLAWDEWNVWYKDRTMHGNWTEAPHLIEEVYNLEDALVVAQWLNVFLRRCDLLKIACLAQIVNVIAPILTTTDALLKQSIFYPFALFSRHAAGVALDPLVNAPLQETARYGPVPLLDASASYAAEQGVGALFLVNRSQSAPLETTIRWQGETPEALTAGWQLSGTDPKRANSFAEPNAVVARSIAPPALSGSATQILLPPLSFTVLTYAALKP